jgi:acetyl-CoA C-acetyltransferase
MAEEIVIVAAKRTPIGAFQGSLASVSAPQLGATAISAAVEQAGIDKSQINECIMGNVLTGGVAQAPARQAAIYSGLPEHVECMTINKVCGSGLKSVMLAADTLTCGHAEVIVAGGQENMTQAPYMLPKARDGYRMGNGQIIDSMINDGLWDPYNNVHMGNCAEICAKEYKITREQQDEFAQESYTRAQKAQSEGAFNDEITAVEVKTRKATNEINEDDEPKRANFEKMRTLRAAFEKDGTITAANASKINDGAAALILTTASKAKDLGLKPIAKIVSQASFAQEPKWFTTAPVGAIKKALTRANLSASDINLWEINEAFSVVTMAAMQEFKIPHEQVNVHGGAVAIGHPIGASGARIFTTLLHALNRHNKSLGLATLCIGGGEGAAVIVEKM